MANEYMAGFGEDFVEVQVISETNAVKYKLEIFASHSNSSPNLGAVKVNDVTLKTPTSGMNVYQLNNDGTIGTVKNFTFTSTDSSGNTAFTQYLNSLGSGIQLIVSDTKLFSSPIVDTWFSNAYSTAWPGSKYINRFPNSAYCAIYGCFNKKIMQEAFFGNDGVKVEDSRAYLETVFDQLADLGSTGFPSRIVEDTTEYDNTTYKEIRYPSDSTAAPIADYGMSVGQNVLLVCDLYTSTALKNAGSVTRMSIRCMSSTGSVVASTNLDCTNLDAWTRFEQYFTIPTGATSFTAVAAPYPQLSTSVTGVKWGVRNFHSTQASESDKGTSISEFGVNGIRMFSSNENGTSYLLELPDSNVVSKAIIPFENLKETARE